MPGPKNSTNFPTTPFLRSIWVTVSTRSVAVAPAGSLPVSLKPTTCGMSMVMRLAEQRRLGLDAAHAPAHHAQAVDHRGVASRCPPACRGTRALPSLEDHLGEVLEVHLVADAGVRRHHAEVLERALAPAQERVALAVALELQLGVGLERCRGAELVHLHRVVDDQVRRVARVDLRSGRRPCAASASRIAARSTTAGTPVKSWSSTRAGWKEISVSGVGLRVPGEHLLHVLALHHPAVLVAEQVLEQHLERERQLLHRGVGLGEHVQREDLVGLAADLQAASGLEGVGGHGRFWGMPGRATERNDRALDGLHAWCARDGWGFNRVATVAHLPHIPGVGRPPRQEASQPWTLGDKSRKG